MDTAFVRELNQEILFVFDAALLVFISAYLIRFVRERGLAEAMRHMGPRAAAAVGIHDLGLTISRGWAVAMYLLRGTGHEATATRVEETYQVVLVGLVFAVVGMMLTIRVFSPARWGHWCWLIAFMAATAFVLWAHWPWPFA